MPYYVYRIEHGATPLVKQLTLLESFETFKPAKTFARELRAEQLGDDATIIKVIFADNPLQAEERLQEKREAPILKEWEK